MDRPEAGGCGGFTITVVRGAWRRPVIRPNRLPATKPRLYELVSRGMVVVTLL